MSSWLSTSTLRTKQKTRDSQPGAERVHSSRDGTNIRLAACEMRTQVCPRKTHACHDSNPTVPCCAVRTFEPRKKGSPPHSLAYTAPQIITKLLLDPFFTWVEYTISGVKQRTRYDLSTCVVRPNKYPHSFQLLPRRSGGRWGCCTETCRVKPYCTLCSVLCATSTRSVFCLSPRVSTKPLPPAHPRCSRSCSCSKRWLRPNKSACSPPRLSPSERMRTSLTRTSS